MWEHFDMEGGYLEVLSSRHMPGAQWFPGAHLNYTERLFRSKPLDRVAIRHASESRAPGEWTWGRLQEEVTRIAAGLVSLGVVQGDRVAAFMPNIPETVAAFLATASLGAIWASAPPEFGVRSVLDRFSQIQPKVLLVVDGYRYGGREFDCSEKLAQIVSGLDVAHVVKFGYLGESGWESGFLVDDQRELTFARVPFDHPLWVLFTSGTTGLPKALVHGQGGVVLEQLKTAHLHLDAQESDRIFWFTTTGWMMWNYLVGVLLTDASIVLYDGSPSGEVLWNLAADTGTTIFGTSAAFIEASMKADVEPRGEGRNLTALRAVGSTGSPLTSEDFAWVYRQLGNDIWLFSVSGGTDVATAFVGGVPTLPVFKGEIQAPALGVKVEAWDEEGHSVVGRVGELVVTEPMPSMPIRLWNDPDGSRLRESYFEMYPGNWRQGDWIEITERGTVIVRGRSDATINRGGIRMGTSEIYRSVLLDGDVMDALVVDFPVGDDDNWMLLFVVLRDGVVLDDQLATRLRNRIRFDCSPRHVPDEVVQIGEVPRTLSGKSLEVPVKRILMGVPAERVVSRDSLMNPAALDWLVDFAARRQEEQGREDEDAPTTQGSRT
jgi:acetoacetyl-CoA synthetase